MWHSFEQNQNFEKLPSGCVKQQNRGELFSKNAVQMHHFGLPSNTDILGVRCEMNI